MLKVLRIILLSFPVLWSNCLSQSISQSVLVPFGGVFSDSKLSISMSVGETMITTTGCSFYILTQGFQQKSIDFRLHDDDEFEAKVYPNPATDFITIEIVGLEAQTFRIEFMDLTGRVFITAKKTFGMNYWYHEQYNVRELLSGFYMVRIMSTDGLFNRTFRIQKI